MTAATQHADTSGDPGPTVFVLFGATGDLANRMVLPAFYRLAHEGLLPAQWLLVGNGRGDVAHEDFRAHFRDSVTESGIKPETQDWNAFRQRPAETRGRCPCQVICTVVRPTPTSRAITRALACAPKCNCSPCRIRRMDSLSVGIPSLHRLRWGNMDPGEH